MAQGPNSTTVVSVTTRLPVITTSTVTASATASLLSTITPNTTRTSTVTSIITSSTVDEQTIASETRNPSENFDSPDVPIIPPSPTNSKEKPKQTGIANASQAIIFSFLVVGVCVIIAALGITGFKIYSKKV